MRIRKNAKISALFYTTNGGHESPCLIQNNLNNLNLICELNQSPWDIITFSSSDTSSSPSSSSFHQHQLDAYAVNYNVNIAGNRRWFDSISDFKSVSLKTTSGLGENDDFNGRNDDGLGENDNVNSRNDGLGENDNVNGRKKSVNDGGKNLGCKELKTSEIQEEISLCGETDEEGWQCGNVVKNDGTMCDYHLSELQSLKFGADQPGPMTGRRPRRGKKRPATNPHDFYYYSGFGPSWSKKRGTMGIISSGIDGDDMDVQEKKRKPYEPEMSEMRPMESDYTDEEEHDDDDDDDEKGKLGINHKKRGRKPIKERSLKSLM